MRKPLERTSRRSKNLHKTVAHAYCKPCHNAAAGTESTLQASATANTSPRSPEAALRDRRRRLRCAGRGSRAACARSAAAKKRPSTSTTTTTRGAVRGILCFNCNGGLGQFRDSRRLARDAVAYLRGSRSRSAAELDAIARVRAGELAERPDRLARDVRVTDTFVWSLAQAGLFLRRPPPRRRPREPPGAGLGTARRGADRDRARHHRARDPLRRRRGDGRRPPRHRRLHDREPPDREGVRRRRPLRRRHRRRRRPGRRAGQALPGPARALREDRGRDPVARGQGQPARPARAGQPARGDAGLRGRAALRGLRRAPRPGPRLQLRRHRRQVRGSRLPDQRLGRRPRPQLDQGHLARGHHPRRGRSTSRSGRCSPPPTRTPPPADPTSCARIFPTVAAISAAGFEAIPDDDRRGTRPTAQLGGREEGAGL